MDEMRPVTSKMSRQAGVMSRVVVSFGTVFYLRFETAQYSHWTHGSQTFYYETYYSMLPPTFKLFGLK